MNSQQRRKLRRKNTKKFDKPATFVKNWEDLAQIPESETHRLEIEVENGCGWIHRKNGDDFIVKYLSTHTFYGSNYRQSTWLLKSCGFNVELDNWDK